MSIVGSLWLSYGNGMIRNRKVEKGVEMIATENPVIWRILEKYSGQLMVEDCCWTFVGECLVNNWYGTVDFLLL